jgi:SulP family sulfate permease
MPDSVETSEMKGAEDVAPGGGGDRPRDTAGGSWFAPRDLVVGLTNAVTNIPDAMANAVLMGISPVHGLYSLLVGTPVAALTTGSQLMTVAVTGSMALVAADGLQGIPAEQQISALVALTLLVGCMQIALGLLKAGTLVRFVSNAVTRGFLTGVAVNIVLSQLADFTGYKSHLGNKVLRAIETLLHPGQWDWRAIVIGVLTIAVVLLVELTPARNFAFFAGLALATVVVLVTPLATATVLARADIPTGLPSLHLPSLDWGLAMLLPAISVALVGLVQSAGVGKSVPNRDGRYPSVNRDFVGQGLGNLAAGVVGGVPVGGSLSSTSLVVQLGAAGRLVNFLVGPVVALVLLFFSGVIERVPLPALAALLIIVGVRAVNVPAIRTVLQTSVPSATIMTLTFAATLVVPIQYAVLLGVALSVVQYVYSSSLDIRVVELTPDHRGRYTEGPCPAELPSNEVTILDIYGSVFYAGTDVIGKLLPEAGDARRAVVILRLRGRSDVGSTFIGLLSRYEGQLAAGGGRLMLAGVSAELREQLERTGLADEVGEGSIFAAEPQVMASVDEALAEAERWLADG